MQQSRIEIRISRALHSWVRLILRHRALTIVVGIVMAVLSAGFAVQNLGLNTDTANMISAELGWRQDYAAFREKFAIRDRNIVVVVDAAIAEDAERAALMLADRLREFPELYRGVFVPGAGEFFERHGLLYLDTDELEAITDRLSLAQPIIGRLQQNFSGAEFIGVVSEIVERESTDTEALYVEIASVLDAAASGQDRALSWQSLIAGDSGGSARRYVLLQPVQDFSLPRPAAAAMAGVREQIAALSSTASGDLRMRVTGTVAMEHEEMTSVTRGAAAAGLAALLLVAVVLYAALRSIALLLISIVTLLVGLSATAAFAAATIGSLNLISVAFAVLYIGLGVDFILHIGLRLNELRRDGVRLDKAIVATVSGVGTSLVICSVTTAAGFYAFIPTSFSGVSELGLISGTGMFLSLIVSVSLLPALMSIVLKDEALVRQPWLGTKRLSFLFAQPGPILISAIAIAVLSALLLPRVGFDRNPVNLRDPDTESVQTLRELASDRDAVPLNMVALAPDEGTAYEWSMALAELDEVESVATPTSLIPADQDAKLFLMEDIGLLLGPGFAEFASVGLELDELLNVLQALDARIGAIMAPTSGVASLGSSLRNLLAVLETQSGSEQRATLTGLDSDLLRTLPAQMRRVEMALSVAEPVAIEDLPPEWVDRWIAADGTRLIEIRPAVDVTDNAQSERFVSSVRSVIETATGLPVVYEEAGRTVVRSFELALTYALILIGMILLIFLSRLRDALLVIVPVVLAAGATAAMTVVLGLEFNFANVIALPLLLGVGVDNGIHIVHRMRSEPPLDGNLSGTSTSRAVLASGLTTIASFGNLAFASHLGMSSMGQVLTIGMIAILAATLILLPALLKTFRAA
jgi:hopanoid biosynthesis associated RND transporter like protein HpnN